ncbi:MAG: hypothetical protein KVP17_000208 [Porospora cf. gigantea B]|uniref:uncharacterized protein n=1 Tax=Porospora cf. gigantea B TaxID=2853592 RepID=UPI003571B408|nr:MAG: hypothetical protein KVP17_000208 [Porospora cf. gigantea B]
MQPVDWKQVALDADRERGLESAEAEMQRTGDLHLYISKLKQEVQAQRNELGGLSGDTPRSKTSNVIDRTENGS